MKPADLVPLTGRAKSAAMARAARAKAIAIRGRVTAAGDSTVESDRQKWVAGYVAKGLPLQRVLEVFAPFLEPEVTRYYQQAQAEADN
jgi:hypothetical protein